MNKLKDILYNKNDLLVVFVILAIAALIISNRVDAIMAYPQTVLAQEKENTDEPILSSDLTGSDDENKEANLDENNAADVSSNKSDKTTDQTSADSSAVNYSVYIESGSTGSKIAQTLVDCDLIKDKDTFFEAVSAANAESKLKAGNFIVPKGSTPAEIVQILTN